MSMLAHHLPGLLLVAALVSLAFSANAQDASSRNLLQATFPPYSCVTNIGVSPFYIDPAYTVVGKQVCLTVRVKNPSVSSKLCAGMDFKKLELNINNQCKNAIFQYHVNGGKGQYPTFQTYGGGNLLVKFPQVNLTVDNAEGAQICMDLIAPCPTMDTLCPGNMCQYSIIKSGKCDCCPVGPIGFQPPPPSPPAPSPSPPLNPPFPGLLLSPPPAPINAPPSPPSPFPYCKCNTTAGVTPFSLASTPSVSAGLTGTIYTFTVLSSTPIDPASTCANTTLYKAEFWSSLTCKHAVTKAHINGKQVSTGWDDVHGVWKITNIGFSGSVVPGPIGTIGLELAAKGPCPTLNSLCRGALGTCTYSMFDNSKLCCPLGSTVNPLVQG